MSAQPTSVILRPSWLSTIFIAPSVALPLVPLAWFADNSVLQALVYAAVFGFVFAVIDHRRWVELTPTAVVSHDLWRHRTLDRVDVRSVAKGQWWSGGIRLVTDHRDFWLRVGDRPFGSVSDERLGVVVNWVTPMAPLAER